MGQVTPEMRAHYDRSVERARAVLKQGDKIRVRTCGDGHSTYTFDHWADRGGWMVSRGGEDELHPFNITRVNGRDVSFRDQPQQENT